MSSWLKLAAHWHSGMFQITSFIGHYYISEPLAVNQISMQVTGDSFKPSDSNEGPCMSNECFHPSVHPWKRKKMHSIYMWAHVLMITWTLIHYRVQTQYVYIHTHARTHTCTCAQRHTHTHTHTCIWTYKCTYWHGLCENTLKTVCKMIMIIALTCKPSPYKRTYWHGLCKNTSKTVCKIIKISPYL